jgi:hypothetical protein
METVAQILDDHPPTMEHHHDLIEAAKEGRWTGNSQWK